MQNWLFLIIALGGLVFPQEAWAQFYKIKGIVEGDHGHPLSGASVALHETQVGTVTDDKGLFEIANVKAGTYHLHVSYIGYEALTKTILVENSDVDIHYHLHKSSLEIKEVVIESEPFRGEEEEHSITIEVANEEFLAKNQGVNFVQSMEKLPGVNFISAGTGVAKPMIRGFSFNRISTVVNGIKQEGQQWGADHGLEVDQFGVGRVEIVKGPASVVYGSDAMGGVLNIRPLEAPEKNMVDGKIQLIGQTNSLLYGGSAAVAFNNEGFFGRARYSTKNFGDYSVPADSFVYNNFIYPVHHNELKNTAGVENNAALNLGLSKSWGVTQLTITNFNQQLGFFPASHGKPNAAMLESDSNSRDIDFPKQGINHFKVVSNTNLLISKNWLELDLGFQLNERKEFEPSYHSNSRDTLALQLNLRTYTWNVHYHHTISKKIQAVYGISGLYKQNSLGGFEFLIPEFNHFESGAYTHFVYKYKPVLTLNAGFRVDVGYKDIKAFEGKLADIKRWFTGFAGGLGASWLPSHHFNLKINSGVSFRYPTAAELASNGVHHGAFRYEKGDSSLVAEQGYQFDVSFNYHRERYFFRLTPFFNYFDNYIFLKPTGSFAPGAGVGQIYQYSQASAIQTGLEFSLDLHLLKRLHIGWSSDFVFGYNLIEKYPLPFMPPARGSLNLEYEIPFVGKKKKLQGLYVSFETRLVSPQNRTARNELATEGYVIFNAGLGAEIHVRKNPIRVNIQLRNLSNAVYYHHLSRYRILGLPEPGINLVASIVMPIFSVKTKK